MRTCRQCRQTITSSTYRVERNREHADLDFCSRTCAVRYLVEQEVSPRGPSSIRTSSAVPVSAAGHPPRGTTRRTRHQSSVA